MAHARALVAPPSFCIFHTAIFRRQQLILPLLPPTCRPSSHPSLGLSVFFLSFKLPRNRTHPNRHCGEPECCPPVRAPIIRATPLPARPTKETELRSAPRAGAAQGSGSYPERGSVPHDSHQNALPTYLLRAPMSKPDLPTYSRSPLSGQEPEPKSALTYATRLLYHAPNDCSLCCVGSQPAPVRDITPTAHRLYR